jgi:dCTP diphosphatase
MQSQKRKFMNDTTTTIHELKTKIKSFIEERDWQQFHSPKNMSMNIATEAAELMELFLWVDCNQSKDEFEKKQTDIEQEIADVAIAVFNFCARMNIDLTQAIEEKMKLNGQRYPVEKAKGNTKKYTEL